ncbi:cytochrome P450 6j1-like [Diorhabda sublineata]|uniref:cytochrome P450 6j1-like n=1 Tax=Diorhabda sublineata TaxID=1163346 RepID=UPI0024E0A550|nr:cytochrome P450 6j1-like [Diorhabda sublineata]
MMITILLSAIVIAALSILIHKHLQVYTYWKDRGVPYVKPIPIFGNMYDVALFIKHVGEVIVQIYNEIDEPYVGFFFMDQPVLMIRSPKIIKQILIKDFKNFRNRSIAPARHSDIFRNFLLMAESNRWKYLRNQLTPLFTSGKLKGMIHTINEVSDRLTEQIARSDGPLDTKEVYTNFITEAVGQCFFNIETKCLGDEKSIFREILRLLFHPSHKTLLIQFIYFVRSKWVDILKLDFVDSDAIKFLVQVFSEAVALRKVPNEKTKDVIDVMIKNRDAEDFGKIGHFASGVQFMVAGIETTSTGMSWMMFELAFNQNIQDKLREEIIEVIKKHEGKITWQAIQEMKYLDMCYLETLRRYPIVPFLDRKAIEDYKIEGTNFVIEKGTVIYIPLFGLSWDEKYYPDPYKFDPERFANSPHANLNDEGLTYMPFGAGQRICLGERFAILSTKLVVVKTLLKYKLESCNESPPYPVKLNPKTTFLESKQGLKVNFTPINVDIRV